MKTTQWEAVLSHTLNIFVVMAFLCLAAAAAAQTDPGGGGTNTFYTPLETWSFYDYTNWTSDSGYSPISFTNLDRSYYGNGFSLKVDTNIPAWLHYNIFETNGGTNFTPDSGTVMFWYAPASWSSTNLGGTGPDDYGRLFEVGSYTTNSSYGWWSIYVDDGGNNLYVSAQTNNLSDSVSNYIIFPVSWTTNYFHFIAFTYSPTNTALYLDGGLATNGPGLTVYPGADVLTNGFWIGSDSNGLNQAHGLFNSLAAYNVPLDGGTILTIFNQQYVNYMMNPFNVVMFSLNSGTSYPSFAEDSYSAISGSGLLQWVTNVNDCVYGEDALHVWFTNVTATVAGDGSVNFTFTIEGGQDGFAYDVFAASVLRGPMTNMLWAWLGQGQHCNTYTVNIPSRMAFLIMGTPLDTDGDGISDAYEDLISHTDPNEAQNDGYDVPYAWYLQNGLDPGSALQDPDLDGLLNYQEYHYGTKPMVSEGFNIWTANSNGGIP